MVTDADHPGHVLTKLVPVEAESVEVTMSLAGIGWGGEDSACPRFHKMNGDWTGVLVGGFDSDGRLRPAPVVE